MKRGERSNAGFVLIIIGIVSLLALVMLVMKQPTGSVMQGQTIYVTEDRGDLALSCKNPGNKVIFLGYDANFKVYCCMEDMIGQNECRFPHKILITRKY